MAYTLDLKVTPRILTAIKFLARLVGVIWVVGGIGFVLAAFVVTTDKTLCLVVGVLLIAAGLGFIFVKPTSTGDIERLRRRMGVNDSEGR